MEGHVWLEFATASLIMAAIPGPGVASVVGFALSSGKRTALASVLGMAVGNTIAMSVSLAGADAILRSSVHAFQILKWVGVVYLTATGLVAIIRSSLPVKERLQPPVSPAAAFMTNVTVATFHPKTILFFVAFATQFIRPDAPFYPQAAVLIATFVLIAGSTDALYAVIASSASGVLLSSSTRRWSQRVGGGAVMMAGLALAIGNN